MQERFVKLPNQLFSMKLKPADFLVYTALLSLDGDGDRALTASAVQIGNVVGLHRNTVQASLNRLCSCGILHKHRRYTKDGQLSRNGFGLFRSTGGFTKIPLSVLTLKLSPTQFLVYCFLKKCANHAGRAFPSLRKIAGVLGICMNTILSALEHLRDLQLLHKQRYIRKSNSYGCNNYTILSGKKEKRSKKRLIRHFSLLFSSLSPFLPAIVHIIFTFSRKQLRFYLHLRIESILSLVPIHQIPPY